MAATSNEITYKIKVPRKGKLEMKNHWSETLAGLFNKATVRTTDVCDSEAYLHIVDLNYLQSEFRKIQKNWTLY